MPKVELLICDNCGAKAERPHETEGWVLFVRPLDVVLCPTCWKRILVLAKPLVAKLVRKEPELSAQWVTCTQFEQSCRLLCEAFEALRNNHILGDE